MNFNDNKEIRSLLRKRRLELPISERDQRSQALKEIVLQSREFAKSRTIAFYWPNDGEIDPIPLLKNALLAEKQCFLPILDEETKNKTLIFIEYQAEDLLIPNRFGIMEPTRLKDRAIISPSFLDLVLVPLVAFNKRGQRLGRGAGYYDSTFSFMRKDQKFSEQKGKVNNPIHPNKTPILLGLGYEFQRVEEIPLEPWDIVMDCIATDENFYRGFNSFQ